MDENIGPRPSGSHGSMPPTTASNLLANFLPYEPISRSTSPGIPYLKTDEDDKKRYRPRTFAYFSQLPFEVEEKLNAMLLCRVSSNSYTLLSERKTSPRSSPLDERAPGMAQPQV
ncbi:hypothetical protein ACKAV7_006280 [Fusarium commune]